MQSALNKVLEQRVAVRDGERTKQMSKLDALMETIVNRAFKDPPILRAILPLLLQIRSAENLNQTESDRAASEEAFTAIANALDELSAFKQREGLIKQKEEELARQSNSSIPKRTKD